MHHSLELVSDFYGKRFFHQRSFIHNIFYYNRLYAFMASNGNNSIPSISIRVEYDDDNIAIFFFLDKCKKDLAKHDQEFTCATHSEEHHDTLAPFINSNMAS